jgi:hypothetical protein
VAYLACNSMKDETEGYEERALQEGVKSIVLACHA